MNIACAEEGCRFQALLFHAQGSTQLAVAQHLQGSQGQRAGEAPGGWGPGRVGPPPALLGTSSRLISS